ncbi:hypothetical protein [Falsigemmobacter intermedius]|uniref:hypothetical protein n=1 Tax=Falsigemmobacter intermedius TaxID=1553448 RepID=UPI003F04EA93
MTARHYSHLFSCLHDEPSQYGNIGRGTHYSVFRMVPPLAGRVQDFAVIWDEDHDTRVIDVIEELILRQLMAPVIFVGERKGSLTVIIKGGGRASQSLGEYRAAIQAATDASAIGDYWNAEVDIFSAGAEIDTGIINDGTLKVAAYLNNIVNLWELGIKVPTKKALNPFGGAADPVDPFL